MRKPTLNRTVQKAATAAARAEQVVLRTPLAVLDEQVLARFAARSKLRAVVGRGISALDSAAGRPDRRATIDEVPAEELQQRTAAVLEEQQQHPLAGELAEDDELRRVQAELMAKHAAEADRG